MAIRSNFTNGSFVIACVLQFLIAVIHLEAATTRFISAPERADMVHDAKRNMLYISSGTRVLRYDLGIEAFRPPFELGGRLLGVDISPDGDFLAVADTTSTLSQNWIHLVDLRDNSSSRVLFDHGGSESGTFTVAFAFDSTLLISALYPGSGWVQLRRYDLATKATQPLGTINQNTMLRASGDRRVIGLAEANNSSGPVRLYDATTGTLEAGTGHGWSNYEIAVNRDGTQFATPTYGGLHVYDREYRLIQKMGEYAGSAPVGLAYHPSKDALFTAWAGSREVRVHNTTSFQELARFTVDGSFEHPGNGSFASGRMRLSADGSLVFVSVPNGVSWFAHELELPSYVRVVVSGTPAQPGSPSPNAYGTNFFALNSRSTNSVPAVAELDGTRYRNAGYSVSGLEVLSTGAFSNTVVFNASTNGTIEWIWTPTHYLLTARTVGSGSITLTNGWIEANRSAVVQAMPAEGWPFVRWIGQVPEAKATDNPLSIEMDQPRVMSAVFSNSESANGLPGDWPTFGRDTMHSGYFAGGLGTNRFAHRWTANFSNVLNQVVVADNKVFITPYIRFDEAHAMALNESSGQLLWKKTFPPNPNSMNPPTYANGAVYIQRGNHSSDSQLIKLDANTGNTIWKVPFSAQWERYFAPVVADGKVWVDGGYYGGLYGFNADTGAQLFFQGLAQYDEWTPAYWNGRLFTFIAGEFTEHDPLSGVPIWKVTLGWSWSGWSMNRTISISDGRAFVVNNPGMAAIDLTTKQLLWEAKGAFQGTPAAANGALYVQEDGTKITVLSAATGQNLGTFPTEGSVMNQPIVTDDILITATAARTDVFDLITKSKVQSIPFGGQVTLANGVLYIAGSDGRLEAWTSTLDKNLLVTHNGLPLGNPSPYGYGVNKVPAGQLTTNSIPTTVDQLGRRYVLDRAQLSGVMSTGSNGSVVFRMTNDAVLNYEWKLTHFQLSTFVSGKGSVNLTNEWLPFGSSAELVATPAEGMRFVRWSSAVSNADASANPLILKMDQPVRITAVFLPVNSTEDTSAEWPTLGNDMGHSSHIAGVLGTNQFHWRWTSTLGGNLQQAAVGGHRVFVIPAVRFDSPIVEALSPYSGQLFWTRSFPPNPNNMSPPTYASGGMFFQRNNHSSDSQVYRLDPVNGDVVWRSPYSAQWPTHLAPVVADDSVYVEGGYGAGLYGYEATSGRERFFKDLEQVDGWTPAYWNGRLFTCTAGNFREHNTTNGEPVWTVQVNADSYAGTATPVVADGFGLVAGGGQLVAIDLGSRTVAWRKSGNFAALPAVANGVVYIREGSTLLKYSLDSGQLLGAWDLPESATSFQPIVADDTVVLSTDNATHIFDLASEGLRQTIPVGGPLSLADRVLYLGGRTGNLQAWSLDPEVILVIRSDSGQIGKPFPFTFGANYVPVKREFEATAFPIADSNAVTRVVPHGWIGTGDIQSGTGSVVRLKLTNESTLTWLWATQHLVRVTLNGSGTAEVTNEWVFAGSNLTVRALPANYHRFTNWTGDLNSTNPVLNLTVEGPLDLTANFLPIVVTNGVPQSWLAQYGLPLTDAGALSDPDDDTLPSWREYQLGLNPVKADTDADSYADNLELAWSSNPTDPQSVPEAELRITGSHQPAGPIFPLDYGVHRLKLFTTNVLLAVFNAQGQDGTRYVPLGWTGSGSIPATGDGNSVSLVLATNSSIHWLWRKEHLLTVSSNFILRDPSSNKTAVASFGEVAPANAAFGASVTVYGDWAAVGAPFATNAISTRRGGAVYLFHKTAAGWAPHVTLHSPAADVIAFGGAVALSQDRLAVTGVQAGVLYVAIFRRVTPSPGGTDQWIFEDSPTTYFEVQEFNEASLAWNSSSLFIGVPSGRSQGYLRGVVLVLSTPSSPATRRWSVNAELHATSSDLREEFGAALAATDEWLIVGAPGASEPNQTQPGAAYIYRVSPLTVMKRVITSNTANLSRFGASVALRGSLALIGAPEDDQGGAAFLYTLGTNTATLRGKLTSATTRPFQRFGASVALEDEIALVGAPEGDSTMSFAGTVQIFSTLREQPEFAGSLRSAAPAPEGWFGYAMASQDGTVIAGAPFETNGRADIYALSASKIRTSPAELWRPDQSQSDLPAAPLNLAFEGITYQFSGWELDGRLLLSTNGDWINPPALSVRGPLTLRARYIAEGEREPLTVQLEFLPRERAAVLHFKASANQSYDLLSTATLGDTNWLKVTRFSNAPSDRIIEFTNLLSNGRSEFFRLKRVE